jgi:tetratricopeptide (TPR) repeat protein
MKNPRTIQIAIIAGIVLLVGFLFSQDIKGLVKPKEDNTAAMPASEPQTSGLNLTDASATAKNLISNAAANEFNVLENAYQKASGEEKVNQAKVLAKKWDDLEQPVPSALYLEEAANGQPTLINWLNAGDRFLKAFDSSRDSLIRVEVLQKANGAFAKAIALDSNDLDAKTGMGITIVNGLGAPMQGIAMLLDVVKKDPKNFKANMSLGSFAIKSGQFDKAITRFKDIIQNIKGTPDAYLNLGFAYESLGKNEEAIDAYLQSKKLAANPTISSFVDKRVAELKK